MQVLEGAQYRLRVKLTNQAGEQLPPEHFRVYAGAFCPGRVPAHFRAERTADEWVLTMPGLKPGRVPWNWQLLAAEYATGVEWLLAAGEVTVTPRHATGSGCVDPGELKIVATLDKTTLEMTVQIGESTAACSLAVVAAQNSAKEAANSAEHATEQAQAAEMARKQADGSATNAAVSAADAHGQATAAGTSATDAANSARDADASSKAAAEEVTKAAAEVEKAKLERETAARLADTAADSAQAALANQQGAEKAAQDAAQAQTGAEQAKTDADVAKLAAQTSEQNAKASADVAAADKAAAEQAKNDALAAQSTAEEQAAIATKAAEAAQAPESIAAQSARPATMLLVRDELMSILGDASLFDIDTDGQKIIVHTDRLSDDKLAAVNDMLERFVPGFIEIVQYNHDISIPWQEIPEGFTVIEWLEATGTQKTTAPISATSEDTYEVKFSKADLNPSYSYLIWIGNEPGVPFCNESAPDKTEDGKSAISFLMRSSAGSWPSDAHTPAVLINADEPYILKIEKRGFYVDGKHYFTMDKKYVNPPFNCTNVRVPDGSINCKIFYAQVREKDTGRILLNLIPCLDDTGAPCMVDRVTRTAYYNSGTGDFLYPGKEEEPATFSLRRSITYAQLTAHGVRRLYHVPNGCTMSKDEYAAANGYKEILEPPAPLDRYWEPQWRETETQIICDWVETEPPAEESFSQAQQNDETLT